MSRAFRACSSSDVPVRSPGFAGTADQKMAAPARSRDALDCVSKTVQPRGMSKHICRALHALIIVGILSASAPTATAQSTNVRPDIVHHGFASALDGENLFVIGGLLSFEGNTRRLTANYKINLTTGDTASISTDVIFGNGNAAALWQGAIYVSGGSALVSHGIGNSGVYSTGFSDAFAVYDIANDRWRTLSDLPTTAIGHCSFANDRSVYVVGGQQERSMRPFRSPYITATRILRYSIADDRWSPIETPEGMLSQYAACTRLGDEYFLIGGFRDSVASNEVRVWNFANNTWRRAPDFAERRFGRGCYDARGGDLCRGRLHLQRCKRRSRKNRRPTYLEAARRRTGMGGGRRNLRPALRTRDDKVE